MFKINIDILVKIIDAKFKRLDHVGFLCKLLSEFVVKCVFKKLGSIYLDTTVGQIGAANADARNEIDQGRCLSVVNC